MRSPTPVLDALPRPIGFVLGGGGSLGAAQVGMLEALHDRGVHADLVSGTSIGALNGAVVAADPIGAASRLTHIWYTLDPGEILPGGWWRRLWTLWRSKNSLYDSPRIANIVHDEIGVTEIEDLAIPYAAIALDVETATAVRFTTGSLRTALLASSAIPGVFPAIERDGRRYYDGGLVTNVPVLDALAMGAQSLVVLDCAFADQAVSTPTTMTETIFYSMLVQQRQQVLRELPVAAAAVPVLYLPGPAPVIVSPLDFSDTPALIHEAYETARAFLATVRVDGPGLYRAHQPERESSMPGTPSPT